MTTLNNMLIIIGNLFESPLTGVIALIIAVWTAAFIIAKGIHK